MSDQLWLQEAGAALDCTEGVPSAPCHGLLGDAVRARARLHWRTDFGWGWPACHRGRHGPPRCPSPADDCRRLHGRTREGRVHTAGGSARGPAPGAPNWPLSWRSRAERSCRNVSCPRFCPTPPVP